MKPIGMKIGVIPFNGWSPYNCVKVGKPYNNPLTIQRFQWQKHTQEDFYITQVHSTLESEEIQSIIEYSAKDDVSKSILATVLN